MYVVVYPQVHLKIYGEIGGVHTQLIYQNFSISQYPWDPPSSSYPDLVTMEPQS